MSSYDNKRPNRSTHYQHFFTETSCSPEMLTEFADAEGMTSMYSRHNEELLELREQLKIEFWRLVDTQLTARQREVIRLYSAGFTQMEIARKLGINQSSITKSLKGNCDYKSSRKKVYGGAEKKLRKLSEKDPKIQELLAKIADLEEENF